MKRTVIGMATAAVLAMAGMARGEDLPAVVPGTVNFQGRLATVDPKGTLKPLTGVQRVDFRLWDAAQPNVLVWERQFPVTCTEDGSFNLTLNDGGAKLVDDQAVDRLADAFQGTERHFEIAVEDFGTLSPALRVTSSPYAFQAQYAAKAPGDFFVDGILTVGGDATFKTDFAAADGTVDKCLTVAAGDGSVKDIEVAGTLIVPPGTSSDMKGLIPVGGILAWTSDTVPEGWAMCDGTNGTPDLRARFVVGADANRASGTTGGEESVTLALGQIPDHQHDYSVPAGASSRRHDYGTARAYWGTYTYDENRLMSASGDGQPHENRPPFYALYFIMRIK